MKIGSLFAGIGGIDLGFEKAGFDVAWANELDKNACITYKANHNSELFEGDIKSINPKIVPKTDILTAGFPCQAFSVAGHRKGFNDDRGNLFFDILDFVDELKPKVIFLENVKNITTHDNGKTFTIILDEIKKRNYYIDYRVMNSSEYGNVPQNRERLYLVAFKNKKSFNKFKFPEKKPLVISISNILESEKKIDDSYYYSSSKYYEQLKKEIIKYDTLYQWRRVYVRENKSNLCPTLTANMGTGGHNVPLLKDKKDIRKLTPRECARFQGYPDTFIFPKNMAKSHLYKQIGNSVTVSVIELLAIEIRKALDVQIYK